MLINILFMNKEPVVNLGLGLYLCGHWNFDMYLGKGWDQLSSVEIDGEHFDSYGVCDSPKQFMEKVGKHLDSLRGGKYYVVSFVKIRKENESPKGGWRWHKWGEYIGNQNPQCEYLYDEPVIEEIYTYHFYKKTCQVSRYG